MLAPSPSTLFAPSKKLFTPPAGNVLGTIWDGHTALGGGDLFDTYTEKGVELPSEIQMVRKRFSPFTYMVIGRRDSCKTLGMTAFGKTMADRYVELNAYLAEHKQRPFRLAANYYVKFADICDPELLEKILEFPSWAFQLFIMIDELQNYAPGRRAMSKRNVHLAQWMTLIRKLRCECMFTTQFPQTIDPQLLYQVDLFVETEKLREGRAIRMYIHDWWGQFSGRNYRHEWPPRRWECDKVRTVYNTDGVWDDYDTEQLIAPAVAGEELVAAIRENAWVGKEIRTADEEETLEYAGEMTKAMVEATAMHDERVMRGQPHNMPLGEIEPQRAKSLVDLINSLPTQSALTFSYDEAKSLDPNLKTLGQWAKRLESAGFEVTQEPGARGKYARRKS